MLMKNALLWLLILALLLPCAGLAQKGGVSCLQGDTVEVVFALSSVSDIPASIMGELEYDDDIFKPVSSNCVSYYSNKTGIIMHDGQPVTVSFRVNRYAPDGEYLISVNVLDAVDEDEKTVYNVSVAPVRVTVCAQTPPGAAAVTPAQTPAPTAAPEPTAMPAPTPAPTPTPAPEPTETASPDEGYYSYLKSERNTAVIYQYHGPGGDVIIPDKLGDLW